MKLREKFVRCKDEKNQNYVKNIILIIKKNIEKMENKLMSMVNFVLEQSQKIEDLHDNLCCAIAYNKIENYANFLKQPLELWMFVPCDEEGNILEEPKPISFGNPKMFLAILDKLEVQIYQQAKEACIFNDNLLSLIEIKELISENKTIEFLINYYYENKGSYLETNKELF